MIGYIKGEIIYSCDKYVVLDTNSVGYKVYILPETLNTTNLGDTIEFWTHLAVKDDALDLYGFLNQQELEFFKLLIGISGIGPKGALGIMGVASIQTLCIAINKSDASYLTKVSGIGTKNAQKIILELKDKIKNIVSENETAGANEDIDVIDALKSLGYTEREARNALQEIPEEIKGTSQKITTALKFMGNKK